MKVGSSEHGIDLSVCIQAGYFLDHRSEDLFLKKVPKYLINN
jgi:hypothetical protein